jgi:hypothetical protein
VLGGETLLSPGDDERYGKALAEELASWACHMDDARIASRFVWRIEDADLPDLARHLTARACLQSLLWLNMLGYGSKFYTAYS